MIRFSRYARLIRLPNVFTALADIALAVLAGSAVEGSVLERGVWYSALALLGASACLYSAGMVWNDLFDLEQDRRERPFRPLASGELALKPARRLGVVLLVLGVAFGALAGVFAPGSKLAPTTVAALLVAAILLYDRWLKRTWAGPLGMGVCRLLNVLMGFSIFERFLAPWQWHVALVVGWYIVGVTWLARTEARQSARPALAGAAAIMLSALITGLMVPTRFPPGTSSPLFPYLLVILGFWVGTPVEQAVKRPTPKFVQAAVKRAIFGLVVLDATLATAVAGAVGLVILVLLLPAMYLGRWIYST